MQTCEHVAYAGSRNRVRDTGLALSGDDCDALAIGKRRGNCALTDLLLAVTILGGAKIDFM
eukprot:2247614-Pyramimonas_sp.AAC.1